MSNKVFIEINEEAPIKVYTEKEGFKKSKLISLDNLYECITQAKVANGGNNKAEYEDSGLLPNRNVKTLQIITDKNRKIDIISMLKTNIEFDATFCNKKYKGIKLPNIVMAVKFVNNKLVSGNIAITLNEVITEDTQLYQFPLANVFTNGRICWGANSTTSYNFESLDEAYKIIGMFLSMPFNTDGYQGSNRSGLGMRDLLVRIQKKGFDNKWLVPLCKYNKFINNLY